MNSIKIINRYIFGEMISPFVISLFFLTFVFLMTRIPEITNMVVNYNADLSAILLMVGFTLPRFLEFTLPMSVMISILLTFMRMSGENEIVALKGAGASLYKLLPPVLVFCLMGTLLTLWVTVFGVSWGKLSLKKKSVELARSSIDLALQERQFNAQLKDIMIYVSHVDMKTKALKDVFIEDKRAQGITSISTAPSGKLIRRENESIYTIRLYKGMINQVNSDDNSVSTINFGHYDINIDLAAMQKGPGTIKKDFDELSLGELRGLIREGIENNARRSEALMVFHEKFSIPFACLSLGLLAFPLGVQSMSLRRSSGFSMGISFFLLYYFLLAAGWSAGETGHYPPFIGMWLPDLIMGGAGLFLLWRNAKEKPVRLPRAIRQTLAVIGKQMTRKVMS
ncbi:LPS export ABC transporter permease LptF [Desulfospira joergensenii]|uniref:LPS export ABC transporter permease LptF n=1 Tax=Desulfospira joergensenii TaxID=53329 RepID=UPI0003B5E508|nr:LPS export ABC transporter permease LptF [Desulfospira joergensenii]